MSDKKKAHDKKVVIHVRNESYLSSIFTDLCTISILIGGVWFNQTFVGGSYFVNAIVFSLLMFFFLGQINKYQRIGNQFWTFEEAIKFLEGEKSK